MNFSQDFTRCLCLCGHPRSRFSAAAHRREILRLSAEPGKLAIMNAVAANIPVILLPLGSYGDHGPHQPMGDYMLLLPWRGARVMPLWERMWPRPRLWQMRLWPIST